MGYFSLLFESTGLLRNLAQQKWCKEGMTINLHGEIGERAQTPKFLLFGFS